MQDFQLAPASVDSWQIPVLTFPGPRQVLMRTIYGLVGNSITTSTSGKQRTVRWKLAVGNAVKAARGTGPWQASARYAITLGFSFHLPSHGNNPLDVENFLKPTLDAVAAGLFCAPDTSLETLPRWNFDDSNFRHLLIHRLPDAATSAEECLALHIVTSDLA